MDISATARFVRLSPSKARDLARKLQGLPVADALKITELSPRKAAALIGKTLKSAMSNAENNADLRPDGLRVKTAVIDEGPRLKRHWPRARGSVRPILKRMCHIRIVLTDGK
jgi:large subunit ribosomal protein L22